LASVCRREFKISPQAILEVCITIWEKSADLIHLDVDGVVLNKPRDIAEAFSKHFQSVYSSSCYRTYSSVNQGAEILHLAPISNSDVQNAIK
jgi:hypothetical protein